MFAFRYIDALRICRKLDPGCFVTHDGQCQAAIVSGLNERAGVDIASRNHSVERSNDAGVVAHGAELLLVGYCNAKLILSF